MLNVPTQEDFLLVETYLKQALTSRWFMPACPPEEALNRVRQLFAVAAGGKNKPNEQGEAVSGLFLQMLQMSKMKRKYYVFAELFVFLEWLRQKGVMVTEYMDTIGRELLELLEELQSEDAAMSAMYAQLELNFSD